MRVSHILLLALLALSVATARVQHKNVGHKQDLELGGEADTDVDTGVEGQVTLGGGISLDGNAGLNADGEFTGDLGLSFGQEEEETPAVEEETPAAQDEELGDGEEETPAVEEETPAVEEETPAAEDEQLGEGEGEPIVPAGEETPEGIFNFNLS